MSKAKAQRKHARRRALERYGIEVGDDTRKQIIAAITAGRSKLVEKQSLRVAVHDVVIGEIRFRVVYDKRTKELVTFLPPDEPVQRILG